jgi:hypothetical protein
MAKPTSIVALLKTVPPPYAHYKLRRGPAPSALGTWSDAGADARRRRRCTAAVYCEIVAAGNQTLKDATRCNGVAFALRARSTRRWDTRQGPTRASRRMQRAVQKKVKKQASRPRRGKRRCAASKAAVWVWVCAVQMAHVCGVRKRNALRPVGRVRGKVEASLLFTTPLQRFESRSWGLLSSPEQSGPRCRQPHCAGCCSTLAWRRRARCATDVYDDCFTSRHLQGCRDYGQR